MKQLWLVLLFASGANMGCTGPSSGDGNVAPASKEAKAIVKKKPSSSFSDTLKTAYPAAVFYYPDDRQLDNIKRITDSMIFTSLVHENFYQIRNAHRALKRYYPLIRVLEAKNARYILFTGAAGQKTVIDLDTKNDAYGLFVFNGKKAPQLVDMTNLETEFNFYFTK
jgi:hypothetical protein